MNQLITSIVVAIITAALTFSLTYGLNRLTDYRYILYKYWLNREGETIDDAVVLIHRKVLYKNDEFAARLIGSDSYLGYVVKPKAEEGVEL